MRFLESVNTDIETAILESVSTDNELANLESVNTDTKNILSLSVVEKRYGRRKPDSRNDRLWNLTGRG